MNEMKCCMEEYNIKLNRFINQESGRKTGCIKRKVKKHFTRITVADLMYKYRKSSKPKTTNR